MLSIDEALQRVLAQAQPLPPIEQATADSLGCTLAEDIAADVDSPPHDKAVVDGFAVYVDDVHGPHERPGLPIVDRVMAGDVPSKPLTRGTTIQVMTGAPIPQGAQAMVMVEDTSVRDDEMFYHGDAVTEGQGITRRGATFSKDAIVLARGTTIRPIEIGLLCEVGRERVHCFRLPHVSVLPTGEELVAASEQPGPGQIRNSNGPMLCAFAESLGCSSILLDVARDDEDDLCQKIRKGLESDILLLSGGVSAGVRDLVPGALEQLGVQPVFHKVSLKPGKPVWFGVYPRDGKQTLVFGLPGNPVSSLVCSALFVRAAIQHLTHRPTEIPWLPVRLGTDFQTRGNRTTFWPGKLHRDAGRLFATPLPWRGSGDMLAVTQADCWIHFETSPQLYRTGEKLLALPIGSSWPGTGLSKIVPQER